MSTALIALAALYVAYRLGRRVGRGQGFAAAVVLASLAEEAEGADHVDAQREAAPWQ